MYIGAFIFNKILDLITRILKNENKFTLKNPYKAYIKGKFFISSNYNISKTSYIKFSK